MPAPPMPTKWIVWIRPIRSLIGAPPPLRGTRPRAAPPRPRAPGRARPRPSRRACRNRRGSSRASRASAAGASSRSGISRPAPAPTKCRALCVWWSSIAAANGTRIAPTPTIASSASVMPPARATTRSAQRYALATSSMNGVDARFDSRVRVRLARLVDAVAPGLMPNLGPARGRQPRERERQRLVQDPRAQAAADDEQAPARAAARGEALARRVARHDRAAHRVADHLGVRAPAEAVRERREDLASRAARATDSSCPRPRSARAAAAACARATRRRRPDPRRSRPCRARPRAGAGAARRAPAASAPTIRNGAAIHAQTPRPRTPTIEIHSTSMPCGGTTRASRPRCVPSHTTARSRARSASATASPGNT